MFENNSNVCFLGDSITADGRWIYELYEFFKETDKKINLYNCGIPGGTVFETLKRLDVDCFNHNPDTVVCMFGLNDIIYPLYGDRYYFSYEERTNAIERFEKSLDELLLKLKNLNINAILMTPPPYGEWNESETENLYHSNKGVALICEILKKLSDKYSVPLVDINSLFMKYIKEDRLINPDRLHPTAPGHHLIAQGFLKHFSLVNEIDRGYPTKRSPLNNMRYQEEMILRGIIFVEWHILKDMMGKSISEIKERAKAEMKKYTPKDFFYNQLEIYVEHIDKREEHIALLERYTKE